MRSTDILAIGDRVLPGRYAHPQRFDHVVNFFRGARVVSLVSEHIGAGPANVVIATRAWENWREAGNILSISRSAIRLGRKAVSRSGISTYDSRIRSRPLDTSVLGAECALAEKSWGQRTECSTQDRRRQHERRLRSALRRIETVLRREAPPMSLASVFRARRAESSFPNACLAYQRWHIATLLRYFPPRQNKPPSGALDAARALSGSGIGATPAGDDFIAGVLLALYAFESAPRGRHRAWIRHLRAAALTTNPLSAHFLNMAASGYASADVKRLIRALHEGCKEGLDYCVRAVLKHGHTSGADLLAGFTQTVKKLVLSRGVAHGHQKRNS